MARPTIAERVLFGLGPAFRNQAGDLLADLVEALVSELGPADQLLQPTVGGWAGAFDLDTSPDPAWLGNVTGTRVPGGLTPEEQRTYIRDRPSWRRGTPAALQAAIQTTLVGTRQVEITERDGSPWRLRVLVYAAEAPDPAATLAAALSQKPVGIVLDLVIAAGATFQHFVDVHGPNLDDDQAAFPTFADAYSHVPEI